MTTLLLLLFLWWFLKGTSFVFHLVCFCILISLWTYLLLVCLCSKLSRREWGFHVVHSILLCKSYFVHVPWRVPSCCLEHCFRILWLVTSFVEVSFNSFLSCNLWILNIVWSPFFYSSLDMCIWFHSYYEKRTHYGGALTILAF